MSRKTHRGRSVRLAAAAAGALALVGCAGGSASPSDAAPQTLTVFAAASLADTFTALAADFEAEHEGVDVSLVFDGSSGLASQITEGAPADVFAAANEQTMQTVVDAGLAEDPRIFVANALEIATPPDNPAGVATFADLAEPGLVLVVCAPAVPCGAATETIERTSGVALSPVSEENAVTDVLGKVSSGEADAGLVYATDVLSAGDSVRGIPFPEADDAVNLYPIVALADAPQPALAADFVDFILSDPAQAVFADAGFRPPPATAPSPAP